MEALDYALEAVITFVLILLPLTFSYWHYLGNRLGQNNSIDIIFSTRRF